MDRDAALPLLTYDPGRTYAEFDDTTADALLASLRLPDRARAMLFEVFSHSFFNHEAEMSAAEMIAQFHFYLLGNPEGLAFDCPDEDYATAIWEPLARHVEKHGGRVLTGAAATGVTRDGGGWRVATADGRRTRPGTWCSPSTRPRSPRWSRPRPAWPTTRPGWRRGCPRSAGPARRTRWRASGATGTSPPSGRCSAGCPGSPRWTR